MRIEYDPDLDAWLAIQKHAAAFFGISIQAFQRWNYAPVKVEGRSKYYDVRAILEDREAAKSEPADDSPFQSLDKESARLKKEQADAAEMKNRLAMGQLMKAETVVDLLLKLAGEINSVFDGIPSRLKNKFPELPAKVIGYIESELARARNAVASCRVESTTDKGT